MTRVLLSGNDPEVEDFVPEEEGKEEEEERELAELLQVVRTPIYLFVANSQKYKTFRLAMTMTRTVAMPDCAAHILNHHSRL